MGGILIGTAILFVASMAMVLPLTNMSLRRRMAQEGVAVANIDALEDLPDEQQKRWQRVVTGYYIMWDMLVLGVVGLIAGLLGYWFIGIAFNAKGWPGMLTFIVLSLLGVSLGGGHV